MKMGNADFLEVNKLLNRVEKQHEELRKVNEEGEPYKHLAKPNKLPSIPLIKRL
ncbi:MULTISPECIES: hypothetical protein [unclassified Peribacillus]|uniref:hypothetical protein n=1 Tax=unclassified Peribacillus TaxID=2675266 RepID=UPI001913643D|nr:MULTISPECIES: hypothetical protein [unclassified Peribacillus]MBK5446317.1 hypothetical protein [Peribacillus sp. TH24]MBK5459013.1 hypothetical protein [Peribacillus sp. TH27]MBK5480827.1 hypothetical protein [Peribacillus sp. TH16]MBK5502379.1 hypothetical protein [Peribacillus sp. TH14]WMX57703.1 hypothetical protein RE409_11080 [Peribacillus sp. R9-11]